MRRLVAEAVRRERRGWALLMVTALALFSALQRPLLAVHSPVPQSDTSNLRRALQEGRPQGRREALRALRAQLAAAAPGAEVPSATVPPPPPPAPEYAVETNATSEASPGCVCPPGPQGPPVSLQA